MHTSPLLWVRNSSRICSSPHSQLTYLSDLAWTRLLWKVNLLCASLREVFYLAVSTTMLTRRSLRSRQTRMRLAQFLRVPSHTLKRFMRRLKLTRLCCSLLIFNLLNIANCGSDFSLLNCSSSQSWSTSRRIELPEMTPIVPCRRTWTRSQAREKTKLPRWIELICSQPQVVPSRYAPILCRPSEPGIKCRVKCAEQALRVGLNSLVRG